MSTNVIILARVSTQKQSAERQINDLTELAKRKNWNIVKVISFKISGAKKNSERNDMIELRSFIDRSKNGTIHKVLVTEISRLGRNTHQVLETINYLKEHSISLYIQNFNIETLKEDGTSDIMASFLLTILAEISQMEKEWIFERLISGRNNYIKKNGKISSGRKQLTDEEFINKYKGTILPLLLKGNTIADIATLCKLSTYTVVKFKRIYNKSNSL